VVNNAGMISAAVPVFESGTVESMDLPTWQAALARNLITAFLVTKAALPAMTSRDWGRIIMVASFTGPVMVIRADAGYATAKAGLIGLTRAAAVDAARHGITVSTPARSPPPLPGSPAPAPPKSPGNTWSSTAATRYPSNAPHQPDRSTVTENTRPAPCQRSSRRPGPADRRCPKCSDPRLAWHYTQRRAAGGC
jgi:NAD(P)-dependent dehydrogenase (short-subunit alcohol dehydrogenase family)